MLWGVPDRLDHQKGTIMFGKKSNGQGEAPVRGLQVDLSEMPMPEIPTPTAYCVKCREKRDIKGAVESLNAVGTRTLKGTCEVCGTTVVRFLPKVK